jgi:large subunit ribosomal protein L10
MSKRLKALIVKELQDDFRGLDRCVIVGLSGIPAGAAHQIRTQLESKNIRLRVVKNTLAAVALKELGITGVEAYLEGPSAVVTGGSDIVDLAKTADELAKSRDGVVVKGGFGEGKVLSSQEIAALSKLPSREEMLAKLAYAMSSTMGNFAGVLGAVQRKFLYALTALKDKEPAAAA